MDIDLKELQHKFAENKVYDAWQYVQSLMETLTFMNASYDLLEKVYEHRKAVLNEAAQEIFNDVLEHKGEPVHVTGNHLARTQLNIAGLEIDDTIYLRKTSLEFFHYARLSVDVLSQIINAALFGEDALPINKANLPKEVSKKLKSEKSFKNLRRIHSQGIRDIEIQYLYAFDNYIKHVKTILITVKNSFMIGTENEFQISNFTYRTNSYPSMDALLKTTKVKNNVINLIEDVLAELIIQVPNCVNNRNRFHSIHFKQVLQETDKGNIQKYVTYFIEVENDLNELPEQIKVMPLAIKPNNEIYSFVLNIDKIFISIKGKGESGIIGIASLQASKNSNNIYKTYNITPCTLPMYFEYIENYSKNYRNTTFNYFAMEGEIIIL
ncbi:hypothetical protein [Anaerotignum sp.]|uniref:hypothetical protein n=1 Tax=Anaerotignum sp. TaxID=2039241 RepID=UPI00289816FD|nr:hypothetical protein [Anaerotignum sp.]